MSRRNRQARARAKAHEVARRVAVEANKKSKLLLLPPEIRNYIYELALPSPYGVVHAGYSRTAPLVRTCRQARQEALLMYYQLNTFRFQYYRDHLMMHVLQHFTLLKTIEISMFRGAMFTLTVDDWRLRLRRYVHLQNLSVQDMRDLHRRETGLRKGRRFLKKLAKSSKEPLVFTKDLFEALCESIKVY